MTDWLIGEAKQQFSRVVHRASQRPQLIYNRDHLVAAVIGTDLLEELETYRQKRAQTTLAAEMAEIREIADEAGWGLDLEDRADRDSWIVDE